LDLRKVKGGIPQRRKNAQVNSRYLRNGARGKERAYLSSNAGRGKGKHHSETGVEAVPGKFVNTIVERKGVGNRRDLADTMKF